MATGFYYGVLLVVWIVFLFAIRVRPLKLRHLFLWISYSLYTLSLEIILGIFLHLYYYSSQEESLFYVLISSLLLYPVMVVLYSLYLPPKKVLWYTVGWILVLQVLEVITINTGTIVLTGWKIIPWSPVTYSITYLFVYLLDGFLKKNIRDEVVFRKK